MIEIYWTGTSGLGSTVMSYFDLLSLLQRCEMYMNKDIAGLQDKINGNGNRKQEKNQSHGLLGPGTDSTGQSSVPTCKKQEPKCLHARRDT